MSLGICGGCKRFARFGADCPFCGNTVGAPRSRKPGRRARNGVLAAAITVAACGGTTAPGNDAATDAVKDAVMEDSAPIPFYGAPTWDAGPPDSGTG